MQAEPVPGCHAARNLDVHHLVPRSAGGRHQPWNLVPLCSAHHQRLHDGLLIVSGRAPDQLVFAFRDEDGNEQPLEVQDPRRPTGDREHAVNGDPVRSDDRVRESDIPRGTAGSR